MSKLVKKLTLICLVLWLPIASSVAAAMPVYASSAHASAAIDEEDSTATITSTLPCHQLADNAANDDESSCAHCVLCHVANSVIPSSVTVTSPSVSHDCPHVFVVVNFASFIPPLLQRPPSISGC